jgi:hypothetical protein
MPFGAEMLITILTRDVIDWLGLMVLVMLTFVAAMWFLLGATGGESSASMFDRRFRNWYTSLQSLFQVVLESTQLDQTLAGENGHPQIAWYEQIAPVHRLAAAPDATSAATASAHAPSKSRDE